MMGKSGFRSGFLAVLCVACCIFPLLAITPAAAHGDLIQRIQQLDREIAAAPADPGLYLKRANLHRLHKDWAPAQADIAAARRLDPGLSETDFRAAQIAFDRRAYAAARQLLDRYLTREPQSADGRSLRASTLQALGEIDLAAKDLDLAIARMPRPSPDLYLRRARLLEAMGPGQRERLLAGLEEAHARLGPVVSVIDVAVRVELARGQGQAALAWLERLPLKVQKLLRWQVRRGDALAAADRTDEARQVYQQSLQAIQAMPAKRRGRAATQGLEKHLQRQLRALNEL
jgi:hypothetical protein